jgi:hypothetical protein
MGGTKVAGTLSISHIGFQTSKSDGDGKVKHSMYKQYNFQNLKVAAELNRL